MKKRALVSLLATTACLAFAAPALASTSATTQPESVSENWAGYEVTPKGDTDFTSVSGGWTEPEVSCSANDDSGDYGYLSEGGSGSYSAFWVGLGGGDENSDALEQIGTQADCSASGRKSYYAWYELVPSAPVKIKIAIAPGDKIWARTSVSGDEVSLTIENKTTGESWSRTLKMTGATPDTSTAEWITEAPSSCVGGASGQCSTLTLADFGKVNFTDTAVGTADATGTISNSNWTSQKVVLDGEAAPGKLSSGGSAFTVKYGATGDSVSYSEDPYGEDSTSGYGDGYPQGYPGSSSSGAGLGGYYGGGAGGQGSWWSDGYPGAYAYSYTYGWYGY